MAQALACMPVELDVCVTRSLPFKPPLLETGGPSVRRHVPPHRSLWKPGTEFARRDRTVFRGLLDDDQRNADTSAFDPSLHPSGSAVMFYVDKSA